MGKRGGPSGFPTQTGLLPWSHPGPGLKESVVPGNCRAALSREATVAVQGVVTGASSHPTMMLPRGSVPAPPWGRVAWESSSFGVSLGLAWGGFVISGTATGRQGQGRGLAQGGTLKRQLTCAPGSKKCPLPTWSSHFWGHACYMELEKEQTLGGMFQKRNLSQSCHVNPSDRVSPGRPQPRGCPQSPRPSAPADGSEPAPACDWEKGHHSGPRGWGAGPCCWESRLLTSGTVLGLGHVPWAVQGQQRTM